MRNYKVIAVALVLVLGVGCKKKAKDDGGGAGTAAMGTGAGTGGSMAGTGAGTGMAPEVDAGAVAEVPKKEIVAMAAAEMKWGPMDPSAPEQSPQIVSLWGDMQKEANGFLIKIKAGSKGMWHTHSGDYHGVVIAGSANHLQAGDKKPTPLPPGSYWFEPGGVPHNSQCLGKEDCLALVHFNEGKADFAPAEEDKKGKRDPKYVEKTPKDIKWAALAPDMKEKSPMISDVWGDSASAAHGRMWKLPAGNASPPHTHSSDYHGVVIKGTVMNHAPDDKAPKEMGPGSYWMQPAGVAHITACKAGSECIAYTYSVGKFDFAMAGDAGGGAGGPAGGSAADGSAAGGSAAGGSAAGGSAAGGSAAGGSAAGDMKK